MANELLLQRIDNLCKEHNISKRTLASIVGISSATMYNWKKSVPSNDTIQKIANYFGVLPNYLTGETDCRTPFQLLNQLSATQHYDTSVPITTDKYEQAANLFGPQYSELFKGYDKLNDNGQNLIMKLINDFAHVKYYQRDFPYISPSTPNKDV